MANVEQGLLSQLKNIEAEYGKPIGAWVSVIRNSAKTKHSEIVALLKTKHGMKHGAAHRVALVARAELGAAAADAPTSDDPTARLYAGRKAELLPIHHKLLTVILEFGDDIATAPKKGYLSLRRQKQFAMLRPAAAHVDVGLILRSTAATARLESAAKFNALFTHRVRVNNLRSIDAELISWLRKAYENAGAQRT